MQKRILVVGSGFAGMWGALAAAWLLEREEVAAGEIEIALVAPKPMLTVRPRLHEAGAANMAVSLRRLFDVTGIRYVQAASTRFTPIRTRSISSTRMGPTRLCPISHWCSPPAAGCFGQAFPVCATMPSASIRSTRRRSLRATVGHWHNCARAMLATPP